MFFNNLNNDWSALKKTLDSTQRKLSEARGLQTKAEIETAAAHTELIVKGHIIVASDRDLKACRENLGQTQKHRDLLLTCASEATTAWDELQKKHDALVEQLPKKEILLVEKDTSLSEKDASLAEKDASMLEQDNIIDGLREEFLVNLHDYNELVVLGPRVFPGFEVADVHKWTVEHPTEATEIRKKERKRVTKRGRG